MLPNLLLVENETFKIINKNNLRDEIKKYKAEGYRMCSITCESLGQEEFELTYHLDLNYELTNLRVVGRYDEEIPSISPIFPSALLHENEYKDLFGINFEGLLIDYMGNLYIPENGIQNPLR
jgi:ech hydrogenase subunit D